MPLFVISADLYDTLIASYFKHFGYMSLAFDKC